MVKDPLTPEERAAERRAEYRVAYADTEMVTIQRNDLQLLVRALARLALKPEEAEVPRVTEADMAALDEIERWLQAIRAESRLSAPPEPEEPQPMPTFCQHCGTVRGETTATTPPAPAPWVTTEELMGVCANDRGWSEDIPELNAIIACKVAERVDGIPYRTADKPNGNLPWCYLEDVEAALGIGRDHA